MKLKGKVALVTGGAKRIGKEIALSLAERGCHVALTYHASGKQAQQTLQAIRRKRVKAMGIAVDQRRVVEVRRAVRSVVREWGRIDILVNNASSFTPTPWEKVTPLLWEDAIAANLTGPWNFAQEAAKRMKKQSAGKIINILDISVASPWSPYLPYSAAKGGLWTLTLGLAKALAPKIQVNGIAPGPILFPPDISAKERAQAINKTLLKRIGHPRDIAQSVLFFVGGSDFITGVVLPVDGGRRLA